MVAGLSGEECALIAAQNSQYAKQYNVTCDDKNECNIIAYSYCEVSAQCGCLAGNNFCLLWDKIGSGPEMCQKDPCFCSQMVAPLGKDPTDPCPQPKPNPPPPPPPLAQNPCIRFGHTIPTSHHVDAMIAQNSDPAINYTWTNMKFGDFSDWVRPSALLRRSLRV